MSILTDAQQKAEASVPEKYRKGFDALMAAGLKLMFSEQTFPEMKQYISTIKGPQDIPKIVAHGITKLFAILVNSQKGKLPMEASGSAMIVLMTHALEYVERVMKMPITEDILAETTRLVMQGHLMMLKQHSGLDDNQFQQVLAGKGHTLTQGAPAGAPQAQAAPPQAQAAPPLGGA